MKKPRFSSVEDFLEDPSFRAAVFAKNPEDVKYWAGWLEAHPHLKQHADEAEKILLSIRGDLPDVTKHEIDSSVTKVLESIKRSGKPVRDIYITLLKVAASIVVALSIGWGLNRMFSVESNPVAAVQPAANPVIVVENKSGKQKLVRLPDGSSAMLSTNSSISFVSSFDTSQREVFLSGEAFFEVAKNPQWPFVVHADELVTQVVGTSFLISAYPESKTFQVLVKSGKVKLFRKDKDTAFPTGEDAAITLTGNEKATLDRREKVFMDGATDAARNPTPAFTRSFEFKRKRIPEVFTILEASYNIKIVYDKDLVNNCTLTASLGDEPLQEKLNMITASLDASYEISGDTVRVSSLKPCN